MMPVSQTNRQKKKTVMPGDLLSEDHTKEEGKRVTVCRNERGAKMVAATEKCHQNGNVNGTVEAAKRKLAEQPSFIKSRFHSRSRHSSRDPPTALGSWSRS